jgi:hypothetical protein
MDEKDFEGSEILEMIAKIDRLDEFFAALDSDDFGTARSLMKRAGVDAETISIVLKKMHEADGKH